LHTANSRSRATSTPCAKIILLRLSCYRARKRGKA
jgi:hypothetical protein